MEQKRTYKLDRREILTIEGEYYPEDGSHVYVSWRVDEPNGFETRKVLDGCVGDILSLELWDVICETIHRRVQRLMLKYEDLCNALDDRLEEDLRKLNKEGANNDAGRAVQAS